MRHLLLTALVATCALGATGCIRVNVDYGNELPQDRIGQITPGHTTKTEILAWFGAPALYTDGEIFSRLIDVGEIAAEDLVALPFADLLVYEIYDAEARGFIGILFNYMRIDVDRDRLVVFFDEHDVVLYYGLTRQREDPHETAKHHEEEAARGGEEEPR